MGRRGELATTCHRSGQALSATVIAVHCCVIRSLRDVILTSRPRLLVQVSYKTTPKVNKRGGRLALPLGEPPDVSKDDPAAPPREPSQTSLAGGSQGVLDLLGFVTLLPKFHLQETKLMGLKINIQLQRLNRKD